MNKLARRIVNFDLATWLVRLSGLVALLSIPLALLPERFDGFLPFNLEHLSHITAFWIGLALIFLSEQVSRRKKSAYYLVTAVLGLLITVELLHARNYLQVILFGLILIYLVNIRRQFVVHSNTTSWRRSIIIAFSQLLVIAAFTAITFTIIDQRHFGRNLKTTETLQVTTKAIIGQPLPNHIQLNRQDRMLIRLLRASGLATVVIIFVGVFRPLSVRGKAGRSDIEKAKQLLTYSGNSSEDFFKIWPEDKSYYFYRNSFLAYGVNRGIAVVLDGASGQPADFAKLRRSFIKECHLNGWLIAVIHASQKESAAWERLGLNPLYIGGEARVDIAAFITNELHNKHFRYVANKAAKDNLEVTVWEPPLNHQQLEQLRIISDAWLTSHHHREYRFIMGYFNEAYLKDCRVGVLTQAGRPVAYANLIPGYVQGAASIDNMRFTSGLSPVAMHFLLMQIIAHLNTEGATSFNLGFAPLTKMDEYAQTLPERALKLIKRFGRRYYSFAGLEQFKNKFSPNWEPDYITYQGDPSHLLQVSAAIGNLTAYRQAKKYPRWIIPLAVVSALLYSSFPLAIILNPKYAFSGLVSSLGQAGEPYAWLFNLFDILSGAILLVILGWVFVKCHRLNRPLRLAVVAAILSCIGAILAAIILMPAGTDTVKQLDLNFLNNPQVLAHAIVSIFDTGGFIAAVILWYTAHRHYKKYGWRFVLAALIVLSTIGLLSVHYNIGTAAVIQRLFIVFYSIWVVAFVKDIIFSHYCRKPDSAVYKITPGAW